MKIEIQSPQDVDPNAPNYVKGLSLRHSDKKLMRRLAVEAQWEEFEAVLNKQAKR